MSTSSGLAAEAQAAAYLEERGLQIIARNWRNRWCEIDLIATDKAGMTHIIEVKYRRTSSYGSGFEYITPDKIQRLQRAASAWMASRKSNGGVQIDIVAVTGDTSAPTIEYLPNAID
jgi:putative endonuclease